MTVVAPSKAWGSVIFCDDIRLEMQGTFNLVGVYNAAMLFGGEPPFLIPKIGLFVRFHHFPNTFLGKMGYLKIFVPGLEKEITSIEVNLNPPPDQSVIPVKGTDRIIFYQFPIVYAPLNITSEGAIRVRVYIEEEEYRIGALTIMKAPTSSTASLPPPSRSPPDAPAT